MELTLIENRTIIIPLPWRDCPQYWRNFAEHYNNPVKVISSLPLHEVLEVRYNVESIDGDFTDPKGTDHIITFKSADDLTYFILKWS